MQDLNLKIATFVRIDGTLIQAENLRHMWEILNIPDEPEYTDARVGIIQKLLAFHEIDLSRAYPGHTVIVNIEVEG